MTIPSENVSLCAGIIEVARIAAARLTVRDAQFGYARLSAPQRTALQAQADRWNDVTDALLAAWRGLPRGSARHLAAMVPTDEELILFALAAAPHLDRTLARAYRGLSGLHELTVGLLLDLAATALEDRLALVGVLHADRALRRSGLVELAGPGPAMLDEIVDPSPSAIAALRGERIAPPGPTATEGHELADELIPVVEAALALPPWRPGTVTVIAGPPQERAAVIALRSALDRRSVWHIHAPIHDAAAWCRDAALSDVHLGVTADEPGPAITALRPWVASTGAAVVVACDGAAAGALASVDGVVSTQGVRQLARARISPSVPPGSVRTALETLGF